MTEWRPRDSLGHFVPLARIPWGLEYDQWDDTCTHPNPRKVTVTDNEECFAEFIDGVWTYCGCEDCAQREADDQS